MLLGYNTNGLAHHCIESAVELLADIGYCGVAITIDHATLNPRDSSHRRQAHRLAELLRDRGLRSVVETGARFLLDPLVKHEPTLLTADKSSRSRRVDFLKHAIDMASLLDSDCVSLWSGILRDPISDERALERLARGLTSVCDYAAEKEVFLGFEPEPGMFVDTMSRFERLLHWVDHPRLKLTMDVGHLYCQGEVPITDYIARWAPDIVNVHIEDMRAGVHEHLMFGEGEMDFRPILESLVRADYSGGVYVELSRHSHEGPTAAKKAFDYLQPMFRSSRSR